MNRAKLILIAGILIVNMANALGQVFYRTVRVDDLDIFYREAGSKGGPAILLLHGLPSSSRMYQVLLESELPTNTILSLLIIRASDIPPGRIPRLSLTHSTT